MKKIESVTKSATSVTIAVFISRILGLIREQVLAYFFGAGKSMDAYVVAYRIPNLLRDLFAEGALGSAFVKVFSSSLEKEGAHKSFKVAQTIISNFLIILLTIVLAGILFSKGIVSIIAPDFKKDPEKFALTVKLTQIMMPFLLLISLSSIVAGMLNTFRIFFLPAVSSGLFNLVSIIVGISGYFILIKMKIEKKAKSDKTDFYYWNSYLWTVLYLTTEQTDHNKLKSEFIFDIFDRENGINKYNIGNQFIWSRDYNKGKSIDVCDSFDGISWSKCKEIKNSNENINVHISKRKKFMVKN